jgi:hypothetical protein
MQKSLNLCHNTDLGLVITHLRFFFFFRRLASFLKTVRTDGYLMWNTTMQNFIQSRLQPVYICSTIPYLFAKAVV